MDTNQKIEYWIDNAKSDLEAAEILFNNNKFLQSLFYCHLTIEKILKAYYWYINNEEPPYVHNLIVLSNRAKINEIMSDDFKKTIDILMPLNIKGRYPDEEKELLKVYNFAKTKEIYTKTEELYKWILKLMKK
ncbi:HEPN domain-containing protein [Candidatus Poribacteria bacterium]|nr:HEPN domain-containing protein [Candidatus Poribacteria bacterium]